MSKNFVCGKEAKFSRVYRFSLIEVTGVSVIQFNYKRRERAYRVPASAGRAGSPSPAG